MPKIVTTIPPTAAPVTWAEAKTHLRLDTDADQTYVESLIDAATDHAEDRLAASLMPRTLAVTFYDGEALELRRGPLIGIVSITDDDDLTLTDYDVTHVGNLARLTLNQSGTYPITVTYQAGYGADADAVPASIRLAILTHVATLYENRESVTDRAKTPVPHSLDDFYRLKARRQGVA